MTAIIEAAARAICMGRGSNPDDSYGDGQPTWTQYLHQASRTLDAVTPLIRAQVLEEAAQVAEAHLMHDGHPSGGTAITPGIGDQIAARIRALKEQP